MQSCKSVNSPRCPTLFSELFLYLRPTKPVAFYAIMGDRVLGFVRLSADVSLLESNSQSPDASNKTNSPGTVVVLAWMGAHPRHVAKYTSRYSQLYPNARILMITPSWGDFVYRPARTQQKRLAPAVDALLAKGADKILVHLFSNGGSKQLTNLTAAYLKQTGRLLPVQALVLDSAPGRGAFWQSIRVLLLTLPRQWYLRPLLFAFTFLLVGTFWLAKHLTGSKDVLDQLADDLNDPQLMVQGAKRCYIYSESDESVSARDVEEHADEARRKGWLVSTEKFVGSAHVGHMRLDGARYWEIVETLWNESCKDTLL